MNDADTKDGIRVISGAKLTEIKKIGFKGGGTIEELLVPLNKIKPKNINGKAWWIDFKDKAIKKGVSFIDAVYLELEKELKK